MRKILIAVSVCFIAYILTYFCGFKIINDGIPYEKQLTERIKEPDLGTAAGIDINKATKWDFLKVYSVGETVAERIVEYREKLGGFRGMADLLGVEGIGEKRLERIRRIFKIEKEEKQDGNN
ncbi:MAG: helix-hairpin-helix domain-containing protein [Clostridia bacterium]|nr:helix-hairpin-helix domain-containing protein [Clostridia bacterium]